MKMPRKLSSIATTVLLTATGCSPDGIASSPPASQRQQNLSLAGSVERPWKGKCDVDAVFTSATTLLITGTCQLSHLGRTTVEAYQTINPGPNGIEYVNSATYTSAGGDILQTTNQGVATPAAGGLSLEGTETAVGGTGRFESANGTATLTGAVRFTGPASTTGAYSLAGSLNY